MHSSLATIFIARYKELCVVGSVRNAHLNRFFGETPFVIILQVASMEISRWQLVQAPCMAVLAEVSLRSTAVAIADSVNCMFAIRKSWRSSLTSPLRSVGVEVLL